MGIVQAHRLLDEVLLESLVGTPALRVLGYLNTPDILPPWVKNFSP
jgi:hypothetical protein